MGSFISSEDAKVLLRAMNCVFKELYMMNDYKEWLDIQGIPYTTDEDNNVKFQSKEDEIAFRLKHGL